MPKVVIIEFDVPTVNVGWINFTFILKSEVPFLALQGILHVENLRINDTSWKTLEYQTKWNNLQLLES